MTSPTHPDHLRSTDDVTSHSDVTTSSTMTSRLSITSLSTQSTSSTIVTSLLTFLIILLSFHSNSALSHSNPARSSHSNTTTLSPSLPAPHPAAPLDAPRELNVSYSLLSSGTNSVSKEDFAREVISQHGYYCGQNRVCRDRKSSPCRKCLPCQCDVSCRDFYDCCPDLALTPALTDRKPQPFPGVGVHQVTCKSTSVSLKDASRPQTVKVSASSFFMVYKCPENSTKDLARTCEDNTQGPPVSFVLQSPSSSSSRLVTFTNVYCARCHGYTNVTWWEVKVDCASRQNLSLFSSPRDVLRTAALSRDCAVIFTPPSSPAPPPRQCYSTPGMVSACNVTQKWAVRDEFLEQACHAPEILAPKIVDGVLYKSVFCYLCNQNGQWHKTELTSCDREERPMVAKLTATFDLRSMQGGDLWPEVKAFRGKCQQGQLFDREMVSGVKVM